MGMQPDAIGQLIEMQCRELKLPGIKQNHQSLAREAARGDKSHFEFLHSCLAEELRGRRERVLQARLGTARFRELKTLDAFDFAAIPGLPKARVIALADAGFVKERGNAICLGPSGPSS